MYLLRGLTREPEALNYGTGALENACLRTPVPTKPLEVDSLISPSMQRAPRLITSCSAS